MALTRFLASFSEASEAGHCYGQDGVPCETDHWSDQVIAIFNFKITIFHRTCILMMFVIKYISLYRMRLNKLISKTTANLSETDIVTSM